MQNIEAVGPGGYEYKPGENLTFTTSKAYEEFIKTGIFKYPYGDKGEIHEYQYRSWWNGENMVLAVSPEL